MNRQQQQQRKTISSSRQHWKSKSILVRHPNVSLVLVSLCFGTVIILLSATLVIYELRQPMTELYQTATKPELRLRFDYTSLERLSPLAKHIEAIQNDCSIRRQAHFTFLNTNGLGSELHIYGMTLCVVLEMKNTRFRTMDTFMYNDFEKCHKLANAPMQCYFPQAEPYCPIAANETPVETFRIRYNEDTREDCPNITTHTGGYSEVRAATTEYLFTRVSDIIQAEGERQLNVLFNSNNGTVTTGVPKNLITVHIRWGDKSAEMELVPIDKYTNAVQQILDNRQAKRRKTQPRNDEEQEVHIYLATEDAQAYEEFMKVKPKHWHVYVDQYYVKMVSFRLKYGRGTGHPQNGLIALGSLLVAMEATDYVLTTASNWSRLMNELRKNVIDPRCNNCTSMIDLLYDEI